MKFINYKDKKLFWWNKNYFYAGTILFIVLCIALDAGLGFGWSLRLFDNTANYENFKIINFFNGLFGSMDHRGGWQHLLLNMLCYAIVSCYLERKYGSLNYFSLTIFICFFSRMANMLVLQNYGGSFSYGFSSANSALYAIFFTDYLFSFRQTKRNKTNIILGAVLIPIIYLVMCFNGLGFDWWPSNLIKNSWHWAGFGTGILTGLLLQITALNLEHLLVKEKE